MRVSGFTCVRNAVRLQYPVVESINSILPIVDEFVVVVGDSDDGTLDLIRGISSSKLRIIESIWNPQTGTGGFVLAQQTNLALLNCTGEWAIYLQADEAIHEADHPQLREFMTQYRDEDGIEGLLFQRLTFYGDYRTMMVAHPFYRDLVCRIVKPHRFVLSRGDAAGFTVHPKYKERGRRLRTVDTGLALFHYGDVRLPASSEAYQREKQRYWGAGAGEPDVSHYSRVPRQFVGAYDGPHPASMRERIVNYPNAMDLASPHWRSTLTSYERRLDRRTRLIKMLGRRSLPWESSDRIVASHRRAYVE